jgi:hypothetical protein
MENKVLPIKPEDITELKLNQIPDEIINAVNELIVEKWDGSRATIKQDEIINRYLSAIISGYNEEDFQIKRHEIFDKHYMDFEEIYRNAGWKVEYGRPAYNESYEPFFIFKKNKK